MDGCCNVLKPHLRVCEGHKRESKDLHLMHLNEVLQVFLLHVFCCKGESCSLEMSLVTPGWLADTQMWFIIAIYCHFSCWTIPEPALKLLALSATVLYSLNQCKFGFFSKRMAITLHSICQYSL